MPACAALCQQAARHNDRLGLSHDVQGPRDLQRQGTSVDLPGRSADANLIRGLTMRQTGSTEHLQRRGEIEGQDTVKCQNDDVLHGWSIAEPVARIRR